MVLSFPGMGTSPPDEGDTQDVTVTLSLRFSATKKVRKSFDTEDEYGAYLRELELGTKNQAERHQTFTMPPASRWTAADLDRLLVATLQFINETAAMHSLILRDSWGLGCSKREAYSIRFSGKPASRRRVAAEHMSVTAAGPYFAQLTFEGGFPLQALLGWMSGLTFDLDVHWYQPSTRHQTRYGEAHSAGGPA